LKDVLILERPQIGEKQFVDVLGILDRLMPCCLVRVPRRGFPISPVS
jgi:hypothetical protein